MILGLASKADSRGTQGLQLSPRAIVPFVLGFLFSLLLLLPLAAAEPLTGAGQIAGSTTYLMVMVHDHCKISVEDVTAETKAPPSPFVPLDRGYSYPHSFHQWGAEHGLDPKSHGMVQLGRQGQQWRYLITYRSGRGGQTGAGGEAAGAYPNPTEMGYMFPDPRLRVSDGIHGAHPPQAGEETDAFGSLFYRPESEEAERPVAMDFILHPTEDGEPIWVPSDVSEVDVYCHNRSAKRTFNLERLIPQSSRGFDAQQATTYPHLTRLSDTGPVESQPNIIFLSAGYTEVQQPAFDLAVERIVSLLEDPYVSSGGTAPGTSSGPLKNQHSTVPFDRYWGLFNVYSVFQPSSEEGASYPGRGISVDNNLNCYHPETAERAITCSMSKSFALAGVSPAEIKQYPNKAIIVVIVNTYTYGGTGMFRKGYLHLCHFFNGYQKADGSSTPEIYSDDKYASLINHETGHAFGNLFDEYDIGISEPTTKQLENCQAPSNGGPPNPVQWQHWIDIMANPTEKARYSAGVTDSGFDVAPSPLAICGFSNYYKPNPTCMMHRVTDFYMCPVCREQSTMVIMEDPFSYQWPRFPLPDPVLVLPDDPSGTLDPTSTSAGFNTKQSGVMLHLPKLLTSASGFDVQWTDSQGTSLASYVVSTADCPQCLEVSETLLSQYQSQAGNTVTFYVDVTDNTVFISDNQRPNVPMLKQRFTFHLKVVPVASAAALTNVSVKEPIIDTKAAFGRSQLDTRQTYQQCLWTAGAAPPLCALNFSGKTYEAPADLAKELAAYDQWVLYVIGGIAGLFLLLWVFAANYYSSKSKNVVRPIFRTEFTGCVDIVRKIMMFSAVLFMVASLGTMGFSVYVYLQTSSALGKVSVLAGMILATGLYIMAFVGFWAVSYRSKKLVLTNGVILIIGFLVLAGLAVVGVTIGEDIQDNDSFWTKQLETLWKSLVKDSPENACAIEGILSCSGFFIPCTTVVESTVYCPTNCEETNAREGTSCKKVLQDFIQDNYLTILSVVFACVGLMIMAIVFNFYYYYSLSKLKKEIREKYNKRIQKHAATRKGTRGGAGPDVNKSKALFILKTLDDGDTKSLITEFRRIDVDGNGELDRKEMLSFFRKALCYHPSQAEIEEIFRVADLDRSGTISLEEFLCIFNPKAVKEAEKVPAQAHQVTVLPRKKSSRKLNNTGAGNEEGLLRKKSSLNEERKAEILKRAESTLGEEDLSSAAAAVEMRTPQRTESTITAATVSRALPTPTPTQQVTGSPTGGTPAVRQKIRDDLL